MNLEINHIKELLDDRAAKYNAPEFIAKDPIAIPHIFTDRHDIEIAGFLAATISWGQRVTILNNAKKLLSLMEYSPWDFIRNANEQDFRHFKDFNHRTFNGDDCVFFLKAIQHIYNDLGGMERIFADGFKQSGNVKGSIASFHDAFFSLPHPGRTRKHVADPRKGSAAKRMNMFLRWMVRKDDRGVDFGIWDSIPASSLVCPLDIHTGTVARKLGLLKIRQNNWKAVEELAARLKELDPDDPVRYDFALFGLGIYEHF
jgi:uncharacterized protein (TIGR02757 family)